MQTYLGDCTLFFGVFGAVTATLEFGVRARDAEPPPGVVGVEGDDNAAAAAPVDDGGVLVKL